MTNRGHQTPAAFLIFGSGLDKVTPFSLFRVSIALQCRWRGRFSFYTKLMICLCGRFCVERADGEREAQRLGLSSVMPSGALSRTSLWIAEHPQSAEMSSRRVRHILRHNQELGVVWWILTSRQLSFSWRHGWNARVTCCSRVHAKHFTIAYAVTIIIIALLLFDSHEKLQAATSQALTVNLLTMLMAVIAR